MIRLIRKLVMRAREFFSERMPQSISNLPPQESSLLTVYNPGDSYQFNWLTLPLDEKDTEGHFMGVGTTGSGKTTVFRMLMQSVLPRVRHGSQVRAIVYDAKEDALPVLSAIVDPTLIKTLNPFDARGVAWAIYKDITEPRLIVELVRILIPEVNETSRFFVHAAREILNGIIISFTLSKLPWTLGDVIRAVEIPEIAKRVLLKHQRSAVFMGAYFDNDRQCADVFSTIRSNLVEIRPVAACWECAQEQVSLTNFFQQEQILILGNSEISRATVEAINRLFFKRASTLLLAMPEDTPQRSWFFIDEAGDAGRMDGLPSLLKKGRSKGGRVALSFQSISSLRNEPVYGSHVTDEILGQIGNRFIGLIECPETAEWASKLVGDIEFIQQSNSYTSGQHSSSTTSYNHVIARSVLPSEFMSIPVCSYENGLTGFVSVRGIGWGMIHIHPVDLFDYFLTPADPDVPAFISRAVECQFLKPWTSQQEETFASNGKALEPKTNPRNDKTTADVMHLNLDDMFGQRS